MATLEKFHYQIVGDKQLPKLVFLHGLMGFGANWRKVTSALQSRFEILTFDQRGHGRSVKPDKGYAPSDYAQDLKEILDELGWEKIDLVGHSMGGRNAIAFSSKFAHRVNRLVIEDIGPNSEKNGVKHYKSLLERVPTPFKSKKEAKEFLLNDFGDPVLGNYFYSNLTEIDGQVDWRFSKEGILETVRLGREQTQWADYKKLSMPILIVRGQNSDYLPPSVYEKMLQINTNAEGVVIPGAGHWVHFDKPTEFIHALERFLQRKA